MEQTILTLVNGVWTPHWLDMPMAVLSSWDFWWPVLVLLLLGLSWKGGFRARSMIVCGAFSILVVDGIVVNGLKDIVGRPRPHQVVEGVRVLDLEKAKPRFLALAKPPRERISKPKPGPQRGGSFPSGHAANNFALATLVFLFYPRYGWLAFLPASLVAYSRIYVGSHWPLDVLAGMLIGALGTLLVVRLMGSLWKKFAPRVCPAFAARHPEIPPPPMRDA